MHIGAVVAVVAPDTPEIPEIPEEAVDVVLIVVDVAAASSFAFLAAAWASRMARVLYREGWKSGGTVPESWIRGRNAACARSAADFASFVFHRKSGMLRDTKRAIDALNVCY